MLPLPKSQSPVTIVTGLLLFVDVSTVFCVSLLLTSLSIAFGNLPLINPKYFSGRGYSSTSILITLVASLIKIP